MYAPNQWETTLQCNVVSHWLGTFTKWSLLLLAPCYMVLSWRVMGIDKGFVVTWWLSNGHLDIIVWFNNACCILQTNIQCIELGSILHIINTQPNSDTCRVLVWLLTHKRHCIFWYDSNQTHLPLGNMGNCKSIIFKLTIENSTWGTHCKIAHRWIPQNITNEKSTLVQVMAWCHQATSHCLSQCWPWSLFHIV